MYQIQLKVGASRRAADEKPSIGEMHSRRQFEEGCAKQNNDAPHPNLTQAFLNELRSKRRRFARRGPLWGRRARSTRAVSGAISGDELGCRAGVVGPEAQRFVKLRALRAPREMQQRRNANASRCVDIAEKPSLLPSLDFRFQCGLLTMPNAVSAA